MTLDRLKTLSDIVAAWFGLIALTAAGVFAIVQYVDKDKADRVKTSLDLLARFNDVNTVAARTKLLTVWRRHEDELVTAATRPGATAKDVDTFVLTVVEAEDLYPSLITMTDFYETVQICVAEKLCDGATSRALFQHDARTFFTLHLPIIESIRAKRRDPSFASHLQAFASAS